MTCTPYHSPMYVMTLSTIMTRVGMTVSSLHLTVFSCKSIPTETSVLFLLSPQSETLSPVLAGRALTWMSGTLSYTMRGDKERLSCGDKTDWLETKLEIIHTTLQSSGYSAFSVRYSTNV